MGVEVIIVVICLMYCDVIWKCCIDVYNSGLMIFYCRGFEVSNLIVGMYFGICLVCID